MKQKPMFICITGIDGVGKTTHVNFITQHLRGEGIKCQYKWLRFHHLFSLPLLAFCRVAGYTRVSTLGKSQKCSYHEFYRSKVISLIYPWILFLDTFIFTSTKVYIPIFFGVSIVCDRFIYDTLIDLAIATQDHEIHRKLIGKLFLKLIPKNHKVILLFANKSTIISRRPELIGDKTFDERYTLYSLYTSFFGIDSVSNENQIEWVNNSLVKTLGI